MAARVVSTRSGMREALEHLASRPGLVPTMGALHTGHVELISRSARENTQTVVSIFVNPTQFGDSHDLSNYPRDLAADVALAEDAGATQIFAPSVAEIYPPSFDTWVTVDELSRRWEGEARPGHFRGVCTIVAILLNLVRPARSYFGEKDYQQLQIIRRMHADLSLPGKIVGCPTVRDQDGLALSSRNARLDDSARERARAIPQAIGAVQQAAALGERSADRLEHAGRQVLTSAGVRVDYLVIVDPETLEPLIQLDREARLLVATEVGGVRLIDNASVIPNDLRGSLPAAKSVRRN